ncbi:MAG: hypothetical protein KDD69_09605 [Bdellovibrionales bacterium]|nr:hypothetical protein [Bdellovibrionales bacterium]
MDAKVFARTGRYVARSLAIGFALSLSFSQSVFAQAGDVPDLTVVDPATPDADLRPGDVVRGPYDVSVGPGTGSSTLAEHGVGLGGDCEELSDYYTYREGRDEVRCTRRGGGSSCDFSCHEVRVDGCFDADTEILMGDGVTMKRIDEIEQGDFVWNPALRRPVVVEKVVKGPEHKPLFEVGYGPYVARVTESHPMVVERSSSGFQQSALRGNGSSDGLPSSIKRASELSLGDRILGADGRFHPIGTLKQLPVRANQTVVNLQTNSHSSAVMDHLLVANGVVTADYYIQQRLSTKR